MGLIEIHPLIFIFYSKAVLIANSKHRNAGANRHMYLSPQLTNLIFTDKPRPFSTPTDELKTYFTSPDVYNGERQDSSWWLSNSIRVNELILAVWSINYRRFCAISSGARSRSLPFTVFWKIKHSQWTFSDSPRRRMDAQPCRRCWLWFLCREPAPWQHMTW